MRKVILSLMLIFPISVGVYSEVGHAKVTSENNRITEKQAREIALQKVKGEVISVELEEDDGLTYYEVKIKSSNNIYEVEIDAKTGKVVEVEKEGSENGDDDIMDD